MGECLIIPVLQANQKAITAKQGHQRPETFKNGKLREQQQVPKHYSSQFWVPFRPRRKRDDMRASIREIGIFWAQRASEMKETGSEMAGEAAEAVVDRQIRD